MKYLVKISVPTLGNRSYESKDWEEFDITPFGIVGLLIQPGIPTLFTNSNTIYWDEIEFFSQNDKDNLIKLQMIKDII